MLEPDGFTCICLIKGRSKPVCQGHFVRIGYNNTLCLEGGCVNFDLIT